MRYKGKIQVVDISLSVSRVGRQTQNHVSNLLSTKIRQVLSEAAELETISRFSSELPPETQLTLKRKDLILEVLKQDSQTPIAKQVQMILLGLIFTTFFNDKNREFIDKYKKVIINAFLTQPKLMTNLKYIDNFKTDDELIKALEGVGPILAQICQ